MILFVAIVVYNAISIVKQKYWISYFDVICYYLFLDCNFLFSFSFIRKRFHLLLNLYYELPLGRVLMLKFIYLCCFFCFYFLLCMLLYFLFSRSLSSLIFALITNYSKIVRIFPISPYFLLYSSLISFYFIFFCIILFYLHLYHLFHQRGSLLEFWQLDME